MRRVDNAAAVQVGLAVLLGLLVVSSALLVLGIILIAIARVRVAGSMLEALTSRIESHHHRIPRLDTIRATAAEATARIAEVERRLATQEHE